MKPVRRFLFFALFLLVAQVWSQSALRVCDVVRLRGGAVLRGQLVATKASGEVLVLRTDAGQELEIALSRVRRIRQRCAGPAPYHFQGCGWYHHSRAGFLPGQLYTGKTTLALQVQHSSGWMFHRLLGAGIGTGFDFFDFTNGQPPLIPLFAEVRSYLLPRYASPFVALGAGIGFCVNQSQEDLAAWERLHWRGGPMAQALAGYRIGHHLTLHTGVRWQRLSARSEAWWWQGGQERLQITHWRFMLGAGYLL